MKTSRFLLAPFLAIFDLNIYREARNEKFGTAVLYSLYLSSFFCVAAFFLALLYMPKLDSFAGWARQEFPAMTLTNGVMKLDKPGKTTLTHPRFGELAVFDDSRTTISDQEMGNVSVYITSTMIYSRSGQTLQARALPSSVQTQNASKQEMKLRLDGPALETYYQRLKWPIIFVFLGVMLIFGFVMRLITGLVFGLIGFVLQSAMPRNLDFEKLFVLACFSFSIGIFFAIFQYVPAVSRFFPNGVGLILSLVYFAIAIAVQAKPVVTEQE